MPSNTSTVALNFPARCCDPIIRPRPVGPGVAIAPGMCDRSRVLPRLRLLTQSQGLCISCQDGYSRWPASGAVVPALDHPAKSLGLAVSDRSIRGVAELSPGCSQLWSAIIAPRPMRPPPVQPVSVADTTKTGVSRGGCDARGSFPAAAQERITSVAILPMIGSVEIFRRLGLSAAAKKPPRVHSVATLLP